MQPQITAALISGSTLFGTSSASFISYTALSNFKVSYRNYFFFPNFFLFFFFFASKILPRDVSEKCPLDGIRYTQREDCS